MSKGGNGQQHHEGDMTFSVEDGGIHYNVSKDFTVTATGDLVHFESAGDVSFKTATNESHKVGSSMFVTAADEIKFTCGSAIIDMLPASIKASVGGSYILIEAGKITIQSARVDINP